MKNSASLPPPDTPWLLSKTVLKEAGLNGELYFLAPGAEYAPEHAPAGETLLFVIAGSVTACTEPSHFVLQAETALRVAAGRSCRVRNPTEAPAKVLVVTLPPTRSSHASSESDAVKP